MKTHSRSTLTFLGLLLRARRSPDRHTQGLTILECLIAIAVIGITLAVITPPLFIAAATRVQNRRAEQALQVAQGEVDRIRVLVNRDRHTLARLPANSGATVAQLGNVAPPTNVSSSLLKSVDPTCNNYNDTQLPVNSALLVDVNGKEANGRCEPDFMMQVFRSQEQISTSERDKGSAGRPSQFSMGVRVYSILAQSNLGNLEKDPASLNLTNGEGKQRVRPLAVVYSPFSWGDRDSTLCSYHRAAGQNICPNGTF